MCIAYIAIAAHPDWPVFIAANRDEYHDRPARAARPWPDHPQVIAGIDEQANGTWLGVTTSGRFALITNFRDPSHKLANPPSRGALTRHFLTTTEPAHDYAVAVSRRAHTFNGFNLILGDTHGVFYVGNRQEPCLPVRLEAGRHVVSNHLLNTPWPKAQRLRQALDAYPQAALFDNLDPVFELLKDATPAPDHTLPSTGVSLEMERLLSSPFIISPGYGTRCSTIVAIHASGRAIFSETSYDPSGTAIRRHDWPFNVSP